MNRRLVVSAAVLLGGYFAFLVRSADPPAKSPEDALSAAASAMKDRDVKAVLSHLTPDSQSFVAGGMAVGAAFEKRPFVLFRAPPKPTAREQEHNDAIDKVLKRHGLPEDFTSLTVKLDKAEKEAKDGKDSYTVLGESVKDKTAFVVEIIEVLECKPNIYALLKGMSEAPIKDVKIEGRRAKASAFGNDRVYLLFDEGAWKVDLIETIRQQPPRPKRPDEPSGFFSIFSSGS